MSDGFPIARRDRLRLPHLPASVSYALLAPYASRARTNHGDRSLAELAVNGLGWSEILALLEDRPWRPMLPDEAAERVLAIAAEKGLA